MNQDNEKTLRNLAVIAALTQNDKINTKDDAFTIYVPTHLRGMTRMIYGETREHNIFRIQTCIREAKQYIQSRISEISNTSNDDTISKKFSMSIQTKQCTRMLHALKQSETGLKSLQITYKDDASYTAQLQILLDEISDFLTTTQNICHEVHYTLPNYSASSSQ
tara:strand:- start:933 stop:1424 length:492 start_codon:yes stop_codon:yes gene_type:complete